MPKKANIFDSFSQSAIQQFKEAFGIMDTDKDGLLSSSGTLASPFGHISLQMQKLIVQKQTNKKTSRNV